MWWFGGNRRQLPEATGNFIPGCTDVMLDYSKDGIFMRLYYPTDAKKDEPSKYCSRWCPWIPDRNYVFGIAKVLMNFTFLVRVALWWSESVIPVIYGHKPKLDQKLKCIVLSHGLGGLRTFYSNFCCELASRGYLVAALEHRDNSACYTYYYKSKEDATNNNRTHIEYAPFQVGGDHFKQRQRQVDYRSEECCKAIDFLIDLNKGSVPYNILGDVPTTGQVDFRLEDLVGNLDLDTLTMAGHSFGGGTALLTLSKRPELKQGVLLDPWMFPIKNYSLHDKLDQEQPLIFINTQTFHIASNIEAMSKYLRGSNRTMHTLLHTTHEHQTDTVLLVGSWLNWFMKKIDPLVALRLNSSIALEFLDKHVGSPSSIADCQQFIEENRSNLETGLTKAWA